MAYSNAFPTSPGEQKSPWIEIGVALGIVAYALLGFTLGARYLAIYHPLKREVPQRTVVREPTSPIE